MTANFRFSKTRQNGPFWGVFDELLSTRKVNVTRFARNIECDFLADFKILYEIVCRMMGRVIDFSSRCLEDEWSGKVALLLIACFSMLSP